MIENYTFTGATTNNENTTLTNIIGNKHLFDANGEEGDYTVYLNYGQDAKVIVTYAILRYDSTGKVESLHKDYTKDVYLGDDFKIDIPEVSDYSLKISYLDGKTYDLTAGNSYTFTVSNTLEHAYLVYVPSIKYPVTLLANPIAGGTVVGDETILNDNLFAYNAKVTIDATAKSGYQFIKRWCSNRRFNY